MDLSKRQCHQSLLYSYFEDFSQPNTIDKHRESISTFLNKPRYKLTSWQQIGNFVSDVIEINCLSPYPNIEQCETFLCQERLCSKLCQQTGIYIYILYLWILQDHTHSKYIVLNDKKEEKNHMCYIRICCSWKIKKIVVSRVVSTMWYEHLHHQWKEHLHHQLKVNILNKHRSRKSCCLFLSIQS